MTKQTTFAMNGTLMTVCLSVRLPVRPPAHLSIHPSAGLSIGLSIFYGCEDSGNCINAQAEYAVGLWYNMYDVICIFIFVNLKWESLMIDWTVPMQSNQGLVWFAFWVWNAAVAQFVQH